MISLLCVGRVYFLLYYNVSIRHNTGSARFKQTLQYPHDDCIPPNPRYVSPPGNFESSSISNPSDNLVIVVVSMSGTSIGCIVQKEIAPVDLWR